MEIKPFKFNIVMKKDQNFKNFFTLVMDDNIEELMGDPISCQKCASFITGKFYICEQYNKWFCGDCQMKQGETNEILCRFDRKGTGISESLTEGEHHYHICIKKVERE